MYSETTRSIKVTVKPVYLEDQSAPADNHYVWAYHVRIENQGRETVQLRRRHWRITDGFGRVHEVRGPGVVGEQPLLAPGASLRIHQRHHAAQHAVRHHGRHLRDGDAAGRELRRRHPRLLARQPASVGPAELSERISEQPPMASRPEVRARAGAERRAAAPDARRCGARGADAHRMGRRRPRSRGRARARRRAW